MVMLQVVQVYQLFEHIDKLRNSQWQEVCTSSPRMPFKSSFNPKGSFRTSPRGLSRPKPRTPKKTTSETCERIDNYCKQKIKKSVSTVPNVQREEVTSLHKSTSYSVCNTSSNHADSCYYPHVTEAKSDTSFESCREEPVSYCTRYDEKLILSDYTVKIPEKFDFAQFNKDIVVHYCAHLNSEVPLKTFSNKNDEIDVKATRTNPVSPDLRAIPKAKPHVKSHFIIKPSNKCNDIDRQDRASNSDEQLENTSSRFPNTDKSFETFDYSELLDFKPSLKSSIPLKMKSKTKNSIENKSKIPGPVALSYKLQRDSTFLNSPKSIKKPVTLSNSQLNAKKDVSPRQMRFAHKSNSKIKSINAKTLNTPPVKESKNLSINVERVKPSQNFCNFSRDSKSFKDEEKRKSANIRNQSQLTNATGSIEPANLETTLESTNDENSDSLDRIKLDPEVKEILSKYKMLEEEIERMFEDLKNVRVPKQEKSSCRIPSYKCNDAEKVELTGGIDELRPTNVVGLIKSNADSLFYKVKDWLVFVKSNPTFCHLSLYLYVYGCLSLLIVFLAVNPCYRYYKEYKNTNPF